MRSSIYQTATHRVTKNIFCARQRFSLYSGGRIGYPRGIQHKKVIQKTATCNSKCASFKDLKPIKGLHMSFVRKLWTEEDVKLLKAMSKILTITQMASRLDRSRSSIKFKLNHLGIKLRARGVVKGHRSSDWTDAEVDTLKLYAGRLTASQIAKKLKKRTMRAVRIKAAHLNISLMKTPWTEDNLDQLLKLRQNGFTFGQIGLKLGKSSGACRNKHAYLTK